MTDRGIRGLVSREPNHTVLQALLGHPQHAASRDELEFFAGENIGAALAELARADIIDVYERPESVGKEGYPVEFWGFTEFGIEVLAEYGLLKGYPLVCAVHASTVRSKRLQKHLMAPRPELPDKVRDAFRELENSAAAKNVAAETTAREAVQDLRYSLREGSDDIDLDDELIIRIYQEYANGMAPADVAGDMGLTVADVHDALASYYRRSKMLTTMRCGAEPDDGRETYSAEVRLALARGIGYSARHVPSGIATQGDTEEEALRALADALTLHRRDEDDEPGTASMDDFLDENQTADEL